MSETIYVVTREHYVSTEMEGAWPIAAYRNLADAERYVANQPVEYGVEYVISETILN